VATRRIGRDEVSAESADGGPDVGVVKDDDEEDDGAEDGMDGRVDGGVDGNLGDWYATVR
jgi:hypothetical protein